MAESIDKPKIPRHVAIIMDGNGRWAKNRNRPRIYGHIHGCSRVREIIREAGRVGVDALTLYAFSSENWKRPEEEITVLMRLLIKFLNRQRDELMREGVRFRAIGNVKMLPNEVQEVIRETQEISKNNKGLQLTVALSYGGREEIVRVVKNLATEVSMGKLAVSDIDEAKISAEMYTKEIGDPDLLIRTSGEVRVSNFLLWQIAYSELYFTSVLWPDFRVDEFQKALASFSSRQRRYGMTSAQIKEHHKTSIDQSKVIGDDISL